MTVGNFLKANLVLYFIPKLSISLIHSLAILHSFFVSFSFCLSFFLSLSHTHSPILYSTWFTTYTQFLLYLFLYCCLSIYLSLYIFPFFLCLSFLVSFSLTLFLYLFFSVTLSLSFIIYFSFSVILSLYIYFEQKPFPITVWSSSSRCKNAKRKSNLKKKNRKYLKMTFVKYKAKESWLGSV